MLCIQVFLQLCETVYYFFNYFSSLSCCPFVNCFLHMSPNILLSMISFKILYFIMCNKITSTLDFTGHKIDFFPLFFFFCQCNFSLLILLLCFNIQILVILFCSRISLFSNLLLQPFLVVSSVYFTNFDLVGHTFIMSACLTSLFWIAYSPQLAFLPNVFY